MSQGDLDLESLADYLHLDRAAVHKLVERGQIPGRKVAGQWRFSHGEIHQWLEGRIGSSGPAELQQMEDALERAAPGGPSEFTSLAERMPPQAIEVPLSAKTRDSVIRSMIGLAMQTGWLWDPARLEEAVRQREDLHSTATDVGAALLHPRRPMAGIFERPFVALGVTEQRIPFGSSRGVMTDLFFLICSVDDREHLQALARISRLLADNDLLADLRGAADARAAHSAIAAAEARLHSSA